MNNNINKYLIEVGVEELPSSYVSNALKDFQNNVENFLKEENISFESIEAYATPRRLALLISGLPEAQESVELEVKGPTKKIAYKEDGTINKPLEGFMKSQGISEKELEIRTLKDVEYVYARIRKEGKNTKEVLSEIIPKSIRKISFPKTMKWGGKNLRFARPIRWILSIYNDGILHFDFEGIPVGNRTRGHRFLGSDDILVSNVEEYETKLEENYVVLDQKKREETIFYQIQQMAKSLGGEVKPDPDLLEELTYIVEYPTAILGNVKEEYLRLPPVVITTPMREHLRFSPIYKSETELMPYFITVRNGTSEHADIVAKGNEKVLDARLEDAKFFFENDRKKPLKDYVDSLKGIVFQDKLGTMYDKTKRIAMITKRIGEKLGVGETTLQALERASYLCKADLQTNMVQEFTELEGTMGSIYAKEDKEKEIVAQAIGEQYMPRSSGAELPASTTGTILSIADKLDTLCGLFAINMIPTGSQDPFALRRSVIGILRMLNGKSWELSLEEMIDTTLFTYIDTCNLAFDNNEVKQKIVDFIFGRISNMLNEENIRYDIVQSLSLSEKDYAIDVFQKARALNEFLEDGEHKMFLEAGSRIGNIAEKGNEIGMEIDEELLSEEEKPLVNALNGIKEVFNTHIKKREYVSALVVLETLTPYIHKYFEDVMIMVEEEKIRNNRIALIRNIDEMFKTIFDPRKIVTNT
ncbi:glycine--tRNA ligase subunit beta [Peptoniphilus sp. KCTC 25270]|uniref:glycine--tRNA ligase subunit beta n=1 Tax=Peptoniphilus sp. KCTC 25270 TaxID=2897414 RepID=UPI001E463133|nr:glycine--tRNA ligase subunit beta [Peptoniphilus sp. KCTC 25270]MCD1146869.1 glycine--tRNA ligase subunit beta [Peptoniphilus sp. KCTC 25270]